MDHAIPYSEYLEWHPDDRAAVIAFLTEEGDRCTMCGTKDSEWREDRYAYVAEAHWCQGCYTRAAEQENIKESLPGTTVRLVANTPLKRAQRSVAARRRRERE